MMTPDQYRTKAEDALVRARETDSPLAWADWEKTSQDWEGLALIAEAQDRLLASLADYGARFEGAPR